MKKCCGEDITYSVEWHRGKTAYYGLHCEKCSRTVVTTDFSRTKTCWDELRGDFVEIPSDEL